MFCLQLGACSLEWFCLLPLAVGFALGDAALFGDDFERGFFIQMLLLHELGHSLPQGLDCGDRALGGLASFSHQPSNLPPPFFFLSLSPNLLPAPPHKLLMNLANL